jgi:hypothetical protein
VKRRWLAVVVVAALLALVVTSEVILHNAPQADPLGKRVLYLPSADMLRLISLGNRGLVADVLYLWSIQYYSQFQYREKFLYLDTVFNLITDLDPLYKDPYRIGALIMSLQTQGDRAEHKAAIVSLYEKGMAALPDDWEIAEVAAWDAYQVMQDQELAVKWMGEAASRPNAPSTMMRLYARWRDDINGWTVEDSIGYWEEVVAASENTWEKNLATAHLFDAYVILHRRTLDPLLRMIFQQTGRCPSSWQEVVDAGYLAAPPMDSLGNPYFIDTDTCRLLPRKKIRWE